MIKYSRSNGVMNVGRVVLVHTGLSLIRPARLETAHFGMGVKEEGGSKTVLLAESCQRELGEEQCLISAVVGV